MPEPSTTLGFWGWLVANSQDIRNLVLAAAALVALPLFAWRVMLVRRWRAMGASLSCRLGGGYGSSVA